MSQQASRDSIAATLSTAYGGDYGTELWMYYEARQDGHGYSARLYQFYPETGEEVWVGDWFVLPHENLESISPFRERQPNNILINACTDSEQDALLNGVSIPFTLG